MTQKIYVDRRKDGTTVGMRAVIGLYCVPEGVLEQTRVYDVKSDEEATARAKSDGLLEKIMIEVITELQTIQN